MKIYLDMPNVVKRSLLSGRDDEFGQEVPDPDRPGQSIYVNGWRHGFYNCLTLVNAALKKFDAVPRDMVMVFEGANPLALRKVSCSAPEYKANRRGKVSEFYTQYTQANDQIREFFLDLGATAVTQDGVEADDILAYLAANSEEPALVYSHDGDLSCLIGVNAKGAMIHVGNNDDIDRVPYGPISPRFVTLYKALVGDPSDNIKGVAGFGDKAFLQVLSVFGEEGLEEIETLLRTGGLAKLDESVQYCKPLQKIVNDQPGALKSWRLAMLYPDAVDTLKAPLRWTHGLVRNARPDDDSRFAHWYGRRRLVHGENLAKALPQMIKLAEASPYVALDLETETSEESDDWVAAQGVEGKLDVLGSEIVSCGLTMGDNGQHTFYLTHRHAEEYGVEQLSIDELSRALWFVTKGRRVVAHNAQGFELPVTANHFQEAWDTGAPWHGMLPDVHCTSILSSYIDENVPTGLKSRALKEFGYEQQTYEAVTQGRKMGELTASEAFSYGTDDTVVTAALYNAYKLRSQLEGTWDAYCKVEQLPMYLSAAGFLSGVKMSMGEMRKQEREDDEEFEKASEVLQNYLIEVGWEGTRAPFYGSELSPADVKEIFQIVVGEELKTQVRKLDKLAILVGEYDTILASLLLDHHLNTKPLNDLVKHRFKAAPHLDIDSPKQMRKLLYEVIGMPERLYGKPTDAMRAHAKRNEVKARGTVQTNELAIQTAIVMDADKVNVPVLQAILTLKHINTRRKLFYVPYRGLEHWETRRVHPHFRQSATNTRRHTCSWPNLQQLPKKTDKGKLRRIVRPHKAKAVIVSMDFVGQELRLAADYSRDENMLSCYIGENLRDIHSLVAAGATHRALGVEMSYEDFMAALESKRPELVDLRSKAKTVNFAEQYGAMAPKIAAQMMVDEGTAQLFLDAKKAMFPRVDEWKEQVIHELKLKGYVVSKMGARRHLREALTGSDYMAANKAERQGPNFKIQGSGAEMTKLAMARMWQAGLLQRFDCEFIGPVHDEVLWSVAIDDLHEFIPALHACMVQQFADMIVPVRSSISFGWNLGDQIEIGEEPTAEAISKGISLLGAEEQGKGAASPPPVGQGGSITPTSRPARNAEPATLSSELQP